MPTSQKTGTLGTLGSDWITDLWKQMKCNGKENKKMSC